MQLPSPFDDAPPAAIACVAAEALQRDLVSGRIGDGVPADVLWQPGGGKMFGVLVVETAGGRLGFLRAFSGMLAGRWELPGFVPPLFDAGERAAIEVPGEAAVKQLHADALTFAAESKVADARLAHAALLARHAEERDVLRSRFLERRAQRRQQRRGLGEDERAQTILLELADASRRDKAERRAFDAERTSREAESAAALSHLERRLAARERRHRIASKQLMRAIHDCYRVRDAHGETVGLRRLYAPAEPPSGAGDCAAPKLLAFAYEHGLRPIAFAEFWWGAPPPTGGRVSGQYYRACREKCGPLLPFMLGGLDVAPTREFALPRSADLDLNLLHVDERIVVVDKPAGLLSVPGRDGDAGDSVLQRIQRRFPGASGPLLIHRLDLDTSGVLVFAFDAQANRHIQRQFIRRTIEKRYLAWIDADLTESRGRIELPLRTDIHDRPRQIVDPVGGRPAITDWEVLERRDGRTRVALYPRTGRTHQLRVHAAHPDGLGAAIVGDRLYGHPGDRLMLHAESLRLRHPSTGAWWTFESPAPF